MYFAVESGSNTVLIKTGFDGTPVWSYQWVTPSNIFLTLDVSPDCTKFVLADTAVRVFDATSGAQLT